ncbi:hypothetical protein [Pseudorhodoplanes sp.]|uniref:hypothetical protein n=1 Tax=Pseudorhodoplanes sp. TaxID=1934341 RepID=UPI002C6C24E1|nr:hypothetical protein [Pseudorhodoplanes sp.]HWV52312.1 hypothetical protein [Pseudorhodoplanes sp.]
MARRVSVERPFSLPVLCGWAALCAAAWLVPHPGFAQAPQPQPAPGIAAPPAAQQVDPQVQPVPDPQQPAPPQLLPQRKPEGFLDAIGRWVEETNAKWRSSVAETNAKLKASTEETNARLKESVDQSNARWKQSIEENNARWRELNQRTEKAAKEAAAAQKEAADALKNLANTRVIEGRQVCEPAANGSPDCQAAAEVICKGKGFATGKSADITTTRKCSARALLQRDASECRTETVVIKAACQ